MPIIGSLLQGVVSLKRKGIEKKTSNVKHQRIVLKKLLVKAKNTAFGKAYGFSIILKAEDILEAFRRHVPVYDYESMHEKWWYRLSRGEANVCWPGKVKYFALTSGTASASSKKIPVTSDMIQAIRRTGVKQLLTVKELDLPPDFFQKSVLMLGGSTKLIKVADYMEGDLSGIMQRKLPFWFSSFYKPGKPIAKERDWNKKLDHITRMAKKWDIVAVVGVPAWVQLAMERIIDYYKVKNIHDIWPNLSIFVHGGVSFLPYKKSFSALLGRDIAYLETYLASEGFLAYQKYKKGGMQLVIDGGIFFEFIPFTEENFSPDGNLKKEAQTLMLDEVTENQDYAILISTVAGAWRYLIGDTVRFTSVNNFEIVITGRTKHFLSLCGEHLSVDNLNRAMEMVADDIKININEFSVAGISHGTMFAHKWYVGVDINPQAVNAEVIKVKLDQALKEINDDYAVERTAALKDIFVEVIPVSLFYQYLKSKGKEGGQNKFPRVIKGFYEEWDDFVRRNYREKCM